MNKLYKKLFSFLFVSILVLVGGFSSSVQKAHAVANITITSAKITAGNEVTVIFNTGGDNLGTAPITAYGIADNGVASLTLASGGPARDLSGVVLTPGTFTAVYTFTGAPATKYDTGSLAVHAPDAILDTNTTPDSLDHGIVSIPLTDGQAPTLAASDIFVNNSVQPNKIILTFSEPLEITAAQTVGNYIVTNGTVGITYTIASAVLSSNNVVTLTLATVNPADNKTFITNDDFNTGIRVTPNSAITDTATPANPYAGGLVTANVYGTYDGTPATVNAPLVRTNATTYKVTFSEKLDLTTAQTLNKYTLGGTCLASTGNPSTAVLQANGVDVVLTIPDTSGCAGGQTVIVTPAGTITDVAGIAITSSAATKILTATPLAKVTGAALSASGVASWNDVANESFFNARLYKNGEPVVSAGPDANVTTYDFLSYMRSYGAGVYTVTVTAIGDGVTYSNGAESDPSSSQTVIRLATVSAGLTWTGDVAHWTAVSDGVSYDVQLYKGAPASGVPVNVPVVDEASGADFTSAISVAGSGTYTYKVTALGNATLILDALAASAASNDNVYVTPLAQVTGAALSASGVATWDNLSNESNFNVQLYKGGIASGAPISITANTLTTDLLSAMRAAGAGVYTVTVTAIGDGVIYSDGAKSDASTSRTIIQLATVSAGLTWTGDVAHFTAVSNGVSYDVQLYKGAPASGVPVNVLAVDVATGADFTSAISVAGSGTYTYKVTALGNATLILDALAASAVSNTNITIAATAIAGVTPPVTGATPVTDATDGTGYTVTSVTWAPDDGTFASATPYTATITITPTTGYTLTGITENQFTTVVGATTVTNPADSGVITAVFPATTATHSSGGGYIPRAINLLAFSGECKPGDLFGVITGKPCPILSVPSFVSPPTPISCPISIYGSTNELVKEKTRGINAKGVQNAINQMKAITPLLVNDGVIGHLSEAGIKNAQQILLVTIDGTWGPKTQQAYELFIKKQCPAM